MNEDRLIKVTAVSYLNARPFIYGLQNSPIYGRISLSLDTPAVCAQKVLSGEADIALVPVAALNGLKNYRVMPGYCIGAEIEVNTVMLFSEVPLGEIGTIILDNQSKTSVELVQLLASEKWKIQPRWEEANDGYEKNITGNTAGLVIGDRCFMLNDKFRYRYDLAAEWHAFTGLPFVFACWVAKNELNGAIIEEFNNALGKGVKEVAKVAALQEKDYPGVNIHEYFTRYISYHFTKNKELALKTFTGLTQKAPKLAS